MKDCLHYYLNFIKSFNFLAVLIAKVCNCSILIHNNAVQVASTVARYMVQVLGGV